MWQVFLQKFDPIFAIFLMIVCLAAAIIANLIVEHFQGRLNSQMVLLIIGGCLVIWIIVICCIKSPHHSRENPEPQPQHQLNVEQEDQFVRAREIIQHNDEKECFFLLLKGSQADLHRITISQIPYQQKIVYWSQSFNNQIIKECLSRLDLLLLQRCRDKHQRLVLELQVLRKNLRSLRKQIIDNFECNDCNPCKFSSHNCIFAVLSAIIAIGITDVTLFSASPITKDWSFTWAVNIMLFILLLVVGFQIGYRICRSKKPYYHKFF